MLINNLHNKREGPRDGRKSRIKFFSRLDVPNVKPWATSVLEGDECTFQQQKNDPNKITKAVEKE
jgi:hypothetical protein